MRRWLVAVWLIDVVAIGAYMWFFKRASVVRTSYEQIAWVAKGKIRYITPADLNGLRFAFVVACAMSVGVIGLAFATKYRKRSLAGATGSPPF